MPEKKKDGTDVCVKTTKLLKIYDLSITKDFQLL